MIILMMIMMIMMMMMIVMMIMMINVDAFTGAPASMEQPLPMSLPPLIPAHSFRPGPGGPEEFPGAPFPGDGPLPRPGSPDRSPNPSNNAG